MLKKFLVLCVSILSLSMAADTHQPDQQKSFNFTRKQFGIFAEKSSQASSEGVEKLLFEGIDKIDVEMLELMRLLLPLKKKNLIYLEPELAAHYKTLCMMICKKAGVEYSENLSLPEIAALPFKKTLEEHQPNEEEAIFFDLLQLGKFYRTFPQYAFLPSASGMKELFFLGSIESIVRTYYRFSPKLIKPLEKAFDKRTPFVLLPVFGNAELGLALQISCHLDNIYPIVFGRGGMQAHGLTFSGLGAALHSVAHALAQSSFQCEIDHLDELTRKLGAQGYATKDVLNVYQAVLFEKYDLHRKTYQQLLKQFVDQEDIPSIVALYLMSSESALKRNYRSNALKIVFSEAIEFFRADSSRHFAKKSFDNMTDEEVIQACFKPEPWASELEYYYAQLTDLARTSRYIAAPSLFRFNGSGCPFTPKQKFYRTDLQKRYDAEDIGKLLKIAGIQVESSPVLSDYIQAIEEGLTKLFEHFISASDKFVEMHQSTYAVEFDALEAQFYERLKSCPTYDPKFTQREDFIVTEHQELSSYPLVPSESLDPSPETFASLYVTLGQPGFKGDWTATYQTRIGAITHTPENVQMEGMTSEMPLTMFAGSSFNDYQFSADLKLCVNSSPEEFFAALVNAGII